MAKKEKTKLKVEELLVLMKDIEADGITFHELLDRKKIIASITRDELEESFKEKKPLSTPKTPYYFWKIFRGRIVRIIY